MVWTRKHSKNIPLKTNMTGQKNPPIFDGRCIHLHSFMVVFFHEVLLGVFKYLFICPSLLGEMIQFDCPHIFQMGGSNHPTTTSSHFRSFYFYGVQKSSNTSSPLPGPPWTRWTRWTRWMSAGRMVV